MSKKLYVYSTLSSDVNYTNHAAGGADLPIALPPVHIKGGAGVNNDRFFTPRGVVTEITEQEAEYLRANPVFQLHEQNGYVQISADNVAVEKAVADMEGRDQSAPMVPADLPEDEQPSQGESTAKPKGKR